ncbi:FtsX-like permease family protein [Herbaspirillum sp.]|uniref:ABC transporter permease n=1 Tax=Herbaspirillum sp. TaxID=1890675 RepID=UPI001B094479|nr:FtsX-like permease family protein [Herbaspirillum sp.]MBO9537886.1 ABC transporter permease [Herbaspirillum sp.]
MNIGRLAFRNIFRNKRRTAITFMSIVAASAAIIVFGGFIAFSFEGLRETTIRTQLGHLQIAKKGYFDQGAGLSESFLIADPARIERDIRQSPLVNTTTWRLTGSGLISSGETSLSARLVGIIPEREEDFTAFETIIAGTHLDQDTPEGCVIGTGLAKGLNATENTTLTILGTTLNGMINALDCNVVGIVRTASKDYDNVYVKVPLSLLQRLFDTTKVEKILVLANDTDQMPSIEKLAAQSIAGDPSLEYKSWLELAEFYRGVVNLYTSIFKLASIVLGIVIFLSIANTMSMSAFERFNEIGALRAIGQTRAGIIKMFVYEGTLIGLIGSSLGLSAGTLLAWGINLTGGITVPAPPGMSTGYTALIKLSPPAFLYSFFTALLASVLSSFYPAWLASRIDIIRALHHT